LIVSPSARGALTVTTLFERVALKPVEPVASLMQSSMPPAMALRSPVWSVPVSALIRLP
jgi:hypothetical protein